jgi:dTDP-4-dehydrorhamnose reductase
MKIVVIGATGQLGADILRNNTTHTIAAPSRDIVDITDTAQTGAYLRAQRPDAVINCAAFHNVPRCEEEPEQAFRTNCIAVRDLAAVCSDIGAWLVAFSSDYVFSGDKRSPYCEDDVTGPLQIYGISRLAGEHAALATAPERAVIIRTCGLYGKSGATSKGGNFVDKCVAVARGIPDMEMGADQTVSPTATDDLSRAVLAVIAHPALRSGIYHLVNEGQCTWHELARTAVEMLGLGTRVHPVDRGGRTGSMRRPLYSALANGKARRMGIALPHWRDALRTYLQVKYPEAFAAHGARRTD